MSVFANEGDSLCCENCGKEIYRFLEKVDNGEMYTKSHIEPIPPQQFPEVGSMAICIHCDSFHGFDTVKKVSK